MGSNVRSISLTDDEDAFLEDYTLSPSQLIKEKIWEMQGMFKKIAQRKMEALISRVNELSRENEKLQKLLLEKSQENNDVR